MIIYVHKLIKLFFFTHVYVASFKRLVLSSAEVSVVRLEVGLGEP